MLRMMIFLFIFSSIFGPNPTWAKKPEESIKLHKDLIDKCVKNDFFVITRDIEVYVVKDLDSITVHAMNCLLPKEINVNSINSSYYSEIYKSKLDQSDSGDGSPFAMKEAVILSDDSLIILTAVLSDIGIVDVQRVRNDMFLVNVGDATKRPAYILNLKPYMVQYLTSGYANVEDASQATFRVHNKKGYFKKSGGAFWFDAIINDGGDILDIVTKERDDEKLLCMTRHNLSERTSLDLTRVAAGQVCVET